MRKTLLATAIGLGLVSVAVPARAAVGVRVGILTCNVGSGYGFIFGSSRDLNCTFSGSGRVEHYTGTVQKFGVDIGYLQSAVIVWAVLAPTHNPPPDALEGSYGGVTAGATAAVGAGANLLVGGSNHQISLQPLSIQGEKGLNVAAGISSITLKPAT